MKIVPEPIDVINRDDISTGSNSSVASNSHDSADSHNSREIQSTKDPITTEERIANTVMLVKAAYDFLFDQVEVDEKEKSDAQIADENRYNDGKDRINAFITQYDDHILRRGGDEVAKYLALDNEISKNSDHRLNSAIVNSYNFKITKEDPSLKDQVSSRLYKVRRAALGLAAGFFLKKKDIARFEKLPEEKREKIKLIQKCVQLENDSSITAEAKKEQYAKINLEYKELTKKEQKRDRRNIWKIMARQAHRSQLLTLDTAGEVLHAAASSVTSPIRDVLKEDISASKKAFKISKKLGKSAVKTVKYVGGKVVESGQFLVKHTVKQPAMIAYRLPMSMLNAAEYLALTSQALAASAEGNLAEKARLEEKARRKYKSLGYEGEKFIRAIAASIGIALVDTAIVASAGGVSLPAIMGIHAGAETILGISEAVHQIQNTKDGVEMIGEKVKVVNRHIEQFHEVSQKKRGAIVPQAAKSIREELRDKSPTNEAANRKREMESMGLEDINRAAPPPSAVKKTQATTENISVTTQEQIYTKVSKMRAIYETSEENQSSTVTVVSAKKRSFFASKKVFSMQ